MAPRLPALRLLRLMPRTLLLLIFTLDGARAADADFRRHTRLFRRFRRFRFRFTHADVALRDTRFTNIVMLFFTLIFATIYAAFADTFSLMSSFTLIITPALRGLIDINGP